MCSVLAHKINSEFTCQFEDMTMLFSCVHSAPTLPPHLITPLHMCPLRSSGNFNMCSNKTPKIGPYNPIGRKLGNFYCLQEG